MTVAANAVLDELMQQEKAKKPARKETKMINKKDGDKTYAGTTCIKIGLPGKRILSQRKGLWEVIFS